MFYKCQISLFVEDLTACPGFEAGTFFFNFLKLVHTYPKHIQFIKLGVVFLNTIYIHMIKYLKEQHPCSILASSLQHLSLLHIQKFFGLSCYKRIAQRIKKIKRIFSLYQNTFIFYILIDE